MCDSCEKTEFGCCIDLENQAYGADFEGCPDEDGSGGGFVDCSVAVSYVTLNNSKSKSYKR